MPTYAGVTVRLAFELHFSNFPFSSKTLEQRVKPQVVSYPSKMKRESVLENILRGDLIF